MKINFKRTAVAALAGLMALAPLTAYAGQTDTDSQETADEAQMTGGWTISDSAAELPADASEAFAKATEDLAGIQYTPVLLIASQVVSGTNYKILCKDASADPATETVFYIMTVYEDLNGNASVTDIEEADLLDLYSDYDYLDEYGWDYDWEDEYSDEYGWDYDCEDEYSDEYGWDYGYEDEDSDGSDWNLDFGVEYSDEDGWNLDFDVEYSDESGWDLDLDGEYTDDSEYDYDDEYTDESEYDYDYEFSDEEQAIWDKIDSVYEQLDALAAENVETWNKLYGNESADIVTDDFDEKAFIEASKLSDDEKQALLDQIENEEALYAEIDGYFTEFYALSDETYETESYDNSGWNKVSALWSRSYAVKEAHRDIWDVVDSIINEQYDANPDEEIDTVEIINGTDQLTDEEKEQALADYNTTGIFDKQSELLADALYAESDSCEADAL